MYNDKALSNLEYIFDDFVATMTYEKVQSVSSRGDIKKYLKELFKDIKTINEDDIYSLTNNQSLRDLMLYYAITSKKLVKTNQKLFFSDLNKLLKEYKTDLIMNHDYIDDNEIENLLESEVKEDKEKVIKSLLNYTFNVVLFKANDEYMFEDLLSDANEVLVSCIYRYNKNDHKSFMNYLKFNLIKTINDKQRQYMNSEKLLSKKDFIDEDFEERLTSRFDNLRKVSELMNNANLSEMERKIIEYIYGLVDGVAHTHDETAIEFKSNPRGIEQIEFRVLSRLRRNSK